MDFIFGQYVEFLMWTSIIFGLVIFIFLLPDIIMGFSLGRKRGGFECQMCGNCCRFKFIDIDKEDVKRLEENGFKGFHNTDGNLMKRVTGRCFFLKNDGCIVHDSRPKVCRNFPFTKIFGFDYLQNYSFCPAIQELNKK